ncbi:hypothetical protein SO694_00187035 [Aureococcus anophagefferens]|uniref:Uncharacterized protein n=1 Tax=Aureococcus anophagefferens TaxID=44056 RepID=A0ABR1FG95_AURAN
MDVSGLVDGGAEDEMEGFFAFLDNQVCGSVVSAGLGDLFKDDNLSLLVSVRPDAGPAGPLAMLQLDAFADPYPGPRGARAAHEAATAGAAAARRSSSRPTAGGASGRVAGRA